MTRAFAWAAVLLSVAGLLSSCTAPVRRTSSTAAGVAIPAASSKYIVMSVSGNPIAMQSPGWIPLVAEWQKAMTEAADAAGVRLSAQEGEPRPTGEAGTLVAIYVNSFRYVAPASRYLGGVFTGNAHVNATVRFLDLATGEARGENSYNTRSRAMQGIFSAMTDKQIRAIANEIMAEIDRRQ